MNVHLRTGTSRNFRLKNAILLYEDGQTTFATLHGIRASGDSAPLLTVGRAITRGFLHTLASGLKRDVRPEILPEQVLVRTSEAIAWWTRACRRPMFFCGVDRKAEGLNGKTYPHPALVFLISGRDLYVRALCDDARPFPVTPLNNAPYWNTDPRGLVCQGDMRAPGEVSVNSIRAWEEAYFQSAFTHPNGAVRLTTHPNRFHGLWTELINKSEFPSRFLAHSRETLREFIEARCESRT
jgi:PRTRC genetic system protein B